MEDLVLGRLGMFGEDSGSRLSGGVDGDDRSLL